jgi:hypothetical protein
MGIAVIGVVVVGGLAVMYGNGQLNLGSLRAIPQKTTNVALAECPKDSVKENDSCVYTLEPLEYYVIKDNQNNFVIYGPRLTEIFTNNGWSFNNGSKFNGSAYSVAKSSVTPMLLTFNAIDKNGAKVPSFTFDYATAKNIQESHFVEVMSPNSIKIRFNNFNIPDKNLNNR